MRRRSTRSALPVRTALVLIVLGAAATWLVAWGFALYGRMPSAKYKGLNLEGGPFISVSEARGPGMVLAAVRLTSRLEQKSQAKRLLETGLVPAWTETHTALQHQQVAVAPAALAGALNTTQARSSADYMWWERASGWPMLALRWPIALNSSSSRLAGNARNITVPGFCKRLLPGRLSLLRDTLPYRPNWPGYLIDTALYAVLWFPIVLAIRWLRGLKRYGKGRCPVCGYDLRGSVDSGCPECGWGRD